MDDSEDDVYASLEIVRNPDGSLTRPTSFPLSPNASPSAAVLSKDVPLNPSNGTWIRIFRPGPIHCTPPSAKPSLPVIIDIHGGGFILLSAASEPLHRMCKQLALHIPAIVVSVEYRLAPEHRLPAAYDDAIDAMRWVQEESTRDPWFDSADLSRCFLMGNSAGGNSAGGNIAFHAALRAPHLRIAGLILNEPAFGGAERTESELRLPHDRVVSLTTCDLLWRLALPARADRDHEFCNPLTAVAAHEDIVGLLPKCLVTGHGQDPLMDRQLELVRQLKGRGIDVVSRFDEDGYHGVEFADPLKRQELFQMIVPALD